MNEVDYIQPYETDSFTSSISLSVIVPNNETNIINKLLSEKNRKFIKKYSNKFQYKFYFNINNKFKI